VSTYSFLHRNSDAQRLAVAVAVSWFSLSLVGLAILLEVLHATRSYAAAGGALSAYGLATAFSSVPRGRLIDHHGARLVLPLMTAVYVSALAAMVGAASLGRSPAVLVVLAAVASASTPPLIGVARTQWAEIVAPEALPSAYAVTALLGDVTMVAGPATAGLLATLVSAASGLLLAAASVTLGASLIIRSLREVSSISESTPRSHSAFRFSGLRTVAIAGVAVGVALGTLDVAVPVLAASRGDKWASGLLLGALAGGSVVGSLLSPRLTSRVSAVGRYVGGFAGLGTSAIALVDIPALIVVAVLLMPAGISWGIANVALYELLDTVVPRAHATEAWTWLGSGEGVGQAAGALVAGVLATRGSLTLAFALVPAGACAALGLGLARRRSLQA
jgi:MFS family permease